MREESMGGPAPAGPDGPGGSEDELRVSTLETFFDLVFVFTLTQLTAALYEDLSAEGALRVVLIFAVLWWMYGGYAWLTNSVPPDRAGRRLLLMAGMAGFLVVALAIPGAFAGAGVAFGLGYLAVVLVHAGLYTQSMPVRGIAHFALPNVVAALLLVSAALAGGAWRYGLWGAAIVLEFVTPSMLPLDRPIQVRPGHFVERHGLLLLIAFGESVVAIGIGIETGAGGRLNPGLAGSALLGLALAGPAVALGLGVALYLAGDVIFRRVLGGGPVVVRAGAALLALACVPLGLVTAIAQLLALVALLVLMLVAESVWPRLKAA